MGPTDEDLDRLLVLCARLQDEDLGKPRVRAAMDALVLEAKERVEVGASSERARARRPRSRRTVWAVALTGATLLTAGGAYVELRTGSFGSEAMTEEDGSEWLDPASPDFPPLVEAMVEQQGLAPGFDAESLVEYLRPSERGQKTVVQESGVRGQVALWSWCTWEVAWLDARDRGDTAAATDAAVELRRLTTDPAVVAVDGGNVVSTLQELADAAEAGDPAPVRRDLSVNGPCVIDT